MNELENKMAPSSYLSVLEVAAIRFSRTTNERQFRYMVALSLIIFIIIPELSDFSLWFVILFPVFAIFFSWIWSLNEQSLKEAEDRTIAHILALEQDTKDISPSSKDEEEASYLHIRSRSQSKVTSIERRFYVIAGLIEIVFVLVSWITI